MNIYQRIVLLSGAIALIVGIWTAPRVLFFKGTEVAYKPELAAKGFAAKIEVGTALMRSVAIVGATVLIFYALKSKNKD